MPSAPAFMKRTPKKLTTERPVFKKRGRPHKNDAMVIDRDQKLNECIDQAVALLGPEIMSLSPKDVMLMAMRVALEAGWLFKAADLASEVAPYIHAKLQNVNTAPVNDDEHRTDDDLLDELAEIRDRAAAADRARVVASKVQKGSASVGNGSIAPGEADTGEASRPTLQ